MGNCTDGVFCLQVDPASCRGAQEEVNGASHTPHGPNDTAAGSDSTSLPITPHSPPTPLVDLLSDSQSGLEYLTDSEERKNLTAG